MADEQEQLHKPVDKWPLLLVGPILRRVTSESVAVFLAARERFTVTLTLYDGVDLARRPVELEPDVVQAVETSLTLGALLHVCVIEQRGVALAPGHLYGYDVELQADSGTFTLASLNLLSGVPLGYVPRHLPGFVVPGSLDDLRIVHASCRKSHGCAHASGGGAPLVIDSDALPLVDHLIARDRTNPRLRPQQLFLTGDQIYSDDVPTALLAALTSAGSNLLGWEEKFPDRRGSETFTDDHFRLQPGKRSDFLDDQGIKDKPAEDTGWSDYAANHLLFFSEWCAMYVFAWSPELWQTRDELDPDDRAVDPGLPYYILPEADDMWEGPGGEDASPDSTAPALAYAQTLPYVRRALANVATYMIFDDHDVTDDWYLNAHVAGQLRGTDKEKPGPGGRRLMRNALAAYAVFQHWGNQPEAFTEGPGAQLRALLDAHPTGLPTLGVPGHEQDADVILDVGAEPAEPAEPPDLDQRMRWDYEVLAESHRVLVLDTRTWRRFPSGPAPVDAAAVLAAAADRIPVVGDFGPDALMALAALWAEAAAEVLAGAVLNPVADQIAAVLNAGADLLLSGAELARAVADAITTWEVWAEGVVQGATALLDALLTAPAVRDEAWATASLQTARAAVADAAGPRGEDALEDTFATATALNAAVFALRTGLADRLRELGLAAIDTPASALRAPFEALSTMLESMAAFLQGAAVSVARAARHAARLAGAWTALAADRAGLLWGGLAAAVVAVLDRALLDSAEPQATLDAAAVARGDSVDPVLSIFLEDGDERVNAELISADALAFQVEERIADNDRHRELTLVVSPGPVFGHWLVELLQRLFILKAEWDGLEGAETWDNEPWSGNLPAFARLLDSLVDLGSVVFLSGDVHYAYSSVNDYRSRDGRAARFVQLTSSSAKNATLETRAIGVGDELSDELHQLLMLQFDFVDRPTREEREALSGAVQALVPWTAEAVREELATRRAAFAESVQDWWEMDLEINLLEWLRKLAAGVAEGWDALQLRGAQLIEAVFAGLEELDDPIRAILGDRLLAAPLMQDQALLLLHSLGIDPDQLFEVHSTVLRDRRADERLGDSPGIAARLTGPPWEALRDTLVRMDRTTVGHNNVGLVSTRSTETVGRVLTHELHWFPIDPPAAQPDPSVLLSTSRDDWIVTRHVAGLTLGSPPDLGPVSAP